MISRCVIQFIGKSYSSINCFHEKNDWSFLFFWAGAFDYDHEDVPEVCWIFLRESKTLSLGAAVLEGLSWANRFRLRLSSPTEEVLLFNSGSPLSSWELELLYQLNLSYSLFSLSLTSSSSSSIESLTTGLALVTTFLFGATSSSSSLSDSSSLSCWNLVCWWSTKVLYQ